MKKKVLEALKIKERLDQLENQGKEDTDEYHELDEKLYQLIGQES